jgi:hypothetical protein
MSGIARRPIGCQHDDLDAGERDRPDEIHVAEHAPHGLVRFHGCSLCRNGRREKSRNAGPSRRVYTGPKPPAEEPSADLGGARRLIAW